MKKFFALILSLAMVLSLAACGGGNTTTGSAADASAPAGSTAAPTKAASD